MINDQSSVINYQSSIFLWKQKRVSATKWVGNRIHEVLIGGTKAEKWDLSLWQWFRGVIKGCWWVYGEKTWHFLRKNRFSWRNRLGIGFMSSRIAGNDRLDHGSSKIKVLAKNSKKNQGKSMIFLVFPACGVGFLTSCRKVGAQRLSNLSVVVLLFLRASRVVRLAEGPHGGGEPIVRKGRRNECWNALQKVWRPLGNVAQRFCVKSYSVKL